MEKKPLEKMPNEQFQKIFISLPWMALFRIPRARDGDRA